MRAAVLPIIATILVLSGGVAFATHEDQVALCHKTASDTNPWVVQLVDANEVQSHLSNGDKLYNGPLKDNGHPDQSQGDEWCNGQFNDVCPNIEGVQQVVPENMVLKDGECVVPTPTPISPETPVVPVTPVIPISNSMGGK